MRTRLARAIALVHTHMHWYRLRMRVPSAYATCPIGDPYLPVVE